MAIFHFSVKVIGRAGGRSSVAAAAYRAAEAIHDERLDRTHNFTNKAGVVHSEILLPAGAPERMADRAVLWNEVEATEKRKDAQLAREVEFAIPREMGKADGIALARDFVAREFVARGMVADLNVHWDMGKDGEAKPHAHVMLAMREVGPDGFGAKVREWNRTSLVEQWREAWANHVNARLAALDIDARIDHRSLEAQGVDLEPQDKIGPAASRRLERGEPSERADDHRAVAARNGARIIAEPSIALDAITHYQATFTRRDLAMFVHRHSDGQAQYEEAMRAVRASPNLIALGKDGRGEERFTSRDMLDTERRLEGSADRLAAHRGETIPAAVLKDHEEAASRSGLTLGAEQQVALQHITQGRGLSMVIGYAGTGKSTMLGVAHDAWTASGRQVWGMALSGIATEKLEEGSRIPSRTIASMELAWSKGRDLPSPGDVLVMDEAGMVGTRQMARVLAVAEQNQAQVVLVGDAEQLQAIEAGAVFRSLVERHGAVEISAVRRQEQAWQRQATRWLATGRTGEAISAYADNAMVHDTGTREEARAALIAGWQQDHRAVPEKSRIILTHTNAEVRLLNEAARSAVREAGGLRADAVVRATRGERNFAPGDRIMFLRNERSLEVKNGTLGQVRELFPQRMTVRLDNGRTVAFDLKHYADIDHGYAATIHKAQGMTVDRAHVLATPGLDRHAAYVALSRHRESVQLHYGRDDFADQGKLIRILSRERAKDMASDHLPATEPDAARGFAERREIWLPERIARKIAEQARGVFAGLRFPTAARPDQARPRPVSERTRDRSEERIAVARYARAWADIERMQAQGFAPLPHQQEAMARSAKALDAAREKGASDLASAFQREPELARKTADDGGNEAMRAMDREAQVRADPFLRSERFVEGWQQLQRDRAELVRDGDLRGARKAEAKMTDMARGLDRDRTVAAILLGGAQIDMKEVRELARGESQSKGSAQEQDRADRGRGFDR
ncbi:Ti-type conjugative transfer relaxase TraA [Sphingobium sp. D43FB]|uniref:Ti-type conjugative transfer relaxase TraA n=1 Tax=Sphingobium sp. D43FB TaxID=2017595 RepID=UPI000BB55362|nr:Ti-type conjugative transfer relaxase TraA [Sphingobium sp. D43FB]PBN41376.1 Ti-type conjugative transfer relaxase TraA [Sphingobium sp. D43FB]